MSKVKVLLGLLDISNHIRVRLACSLQQSLVQFTVIFQLLYLLLVCKHFFLECLQLALLGLQSISQEQRLLDSPLGGRWRAGDGLDECVANSIGTIFINSRVVGDVHNGLVELLFDQLVVCESLSCHGQLGFDLRITLPCGGLQLVVFRLQDVDLRLERLRLHLGLFDEDQVVFVQVSDSSDLLIPRSSLNSKMS